MNHSLSSGVSGDSLPLRLGAALAAGPLPDSVDLCEHARETLRLIHARQPPVLLMLSSGELEALPGFTASSGVAGGDGRGRLAWTVSLRS